jgi:hypothetical protein
VCHLGVTEYRGRLLWLFSLSFGRDKGCDGVGDGTRLGYEAETAEEGAEMEKHDEGVFGACAHFSTGSEGKWHEKEVKSTLRKTQTEQAMSKTRLSGDDEKP